MRNRAAELVSYSAWACMGFGLALSIALLLPGSDVAQILAVSFILAGIGALSYGLAHTRAESGVSITPPADLQAIATRRSSGLTTALEPLCLLDERERWQLLHLRTIQFSRLNVREN